MDEAKRQSLIKLVNAGKEAESAKDFIKPVLKELKDKTVDRLSIYAMDVNEMYEAKGVLAGIAFILKDFDNKIYNAKLAEKELINGIV